MFRSPLLDVDRVQADDCIVCGDPPSALSVSLLREGNGLGELDAQAAVLVEAGVEIGSIALHA